MRLAALALLFVANTALANGRPPRTTGVHFKPGDPNSMYVASTFGLLISHDDGCTMRWVCEPNLGFSGGWDPKYAIAADGTIFATTYEGLRVSRDGGCSFATATAELAPGSPNRIADIWIDALDIGPTGEVWVGTATTGGPNDLYVSTDNGVSFAPAGLASTTVFWKSVKVAPTDATRIYASGYELTPPTAHVRISNDGGRNWTASALKDVQVGTSPITLVAAVDPANPDVVYLISQGAAQSGDKLYRSSDAGGSWTEVLSADGPISGVVIADAQTVYVTTLMQSGPTFIGGPMYRSTTSGTEFALMTNTPQLACLGISPGGDLVGCGANWEPDFAAVMRSRDAATSFSKVWRFVELAGPLPCSAGTPEEDVCHQRMWERQNAVRRNRPHVRQQHPRRSARRHHDTEGLGVLRFRRRTMGSRVGVLHRLVGRSSTKKRTTRHWFAQPRLAHLALTRTPNDHNLMTMGKSTTLVMQAGEFKAKCLSVLDEVASTGREMVITKRGRPIAKIVPLKAAQAAPLEGLIEYQGDLVGPIGIEWKAAK